jgi:ABC-2 type transport system permease protein
VILVELRKLFRRPRTWATIAVLNALPLVVAVLLVLTNLAPRPGQGPAFLSAVLHNGALFPLAALAIVLPLLLPIAVAVVAGDSVAGEAQAGTLRYLLARPAGRTRLLVAKLVAVLAFVVVTVLVVAGVGYLIGITLFDVAPAGATMVVGPPMSGSPTSGTSVSGTTLTTAEIGQRSLMAIGYIAVSMLGVAAFALFFSTMTDSPLGATMGALAVLVASSLLFTLNAASPIAPYLPTRYWLAFVDFFRDPIQWRDVLRGLGLQAVYVGVLLTAAWANFTTKDITS